MKYLPVLTRTENELSLLETRRTPDGVGYVFSHGGYPIFTTHKTLDDKFDNLHKLKIGVSLCSGCAVGCTYCFTNNFEKFKPLSSEIIIAQVKHILTLDDPNNYDQTKVEFKEMGDPLVNPKNTIKAISELYLDYPNFLYVVSSAAPKNKNSFTFYESLNKLNNAGIKIRPTFSVHTTSDKDRKLLANTNLLTLEEIASIANKWEGEERFSLNFLPINNYELSAQKLNNLFDKDKVFIKISYIDPNNFIDDSNATSDYKINQFTQGLEKLNFHYAYRNPINKINSEVLKNG